MSHVRINQHQLPELELAFHNLAEARRLKFEIAGVLGMNALAGFNLLL